MTETLDLHFSTSYVIFPDLHLTFSDLHPAFLSLHLALPTPHLALLTSHHVISAPTLSFQPQPCPLQPHTFTLSDPTASPPFQSKGTVRLLPLPPPSPSFSHFVPVPSTSFQLSPPVLFHLACSAPCLCLSCICAVDLCSSLFPLFISIHNQHSGILASLLFSARHFSHSLPAGEGSPAFRLTFARKQIIVILEFRSCIRMSAI